MPTSRENVNPSLRKILADSHVSAIAIAVLLFRSLDYAFWALWHPFSFALLYIPDLPDTLHITDRSTLFITFSYLFNSFVCLAAAQLLSRWVYGMGPLRSLSKYAADWQGETMFDRLKQALVESYVGAIALGYLFAQGILHFVNIFASPVAGWISRKQYGGLVPGTTSLPGFSLQDALPEVVRFFIILLVWFVLLHWLYFKPLKKETSVQNPEEAG